MLGTGHERGLAEDVAVVMWGEFGRTPRISRIAGRDHWPEAGAAFEPAFTLPDRNCRPMHVLDDRDVVHELL